ncbi:MAG: glycoside hydrolase family 3 C-terminal domain-containing protein, partial [Coriobacteriales bacterium]
MTSGHENVTTPGADAARVPAQPEEPARTFDIDAVMLRLTLAQKCSLLTGRDKWHTQDIPELGVPSIRLSDGPNGLRIEGGPDGTDASCPLPATAFPTESALANSFDTELLRDVGRAIGEEARDAGVDVVLGPGVNMKRSPLGGRNFEYLSEDPLLAGKLAAAYIKGVQSCGVGTSLKHFACNSQEHARMTSDSVVDDRALFEYYLRAFEIAIREGRPWTVMPAYNRLDGVYCCENERLLSGIARGTWGFDGLFVSDWCGQSSNTSSLPAGLDLVMPGPRPDYRRDVEKAVRAGTIDERLVDDAAQRVLQLVDSCLAGRRTRISADMREHLDLARQAAQESTVLLENDGLLPLPDRASVALIGEYCRTPHTSGLGSSEVNAAVRDCAYDAFSELRCSSEDDTTSTGSVLYARGYVAADGSTSEVLLQQAELAARRQDVAVVFVGLTPHAESEGYDRLDLRLPAGHDELVERACAANPDTVVVLQCGGPVEMPWRDKPRAIVLQGLAGCQSGAAIANVLSGRAYPGGRLAETWPQTLSDTFLAGRFPDTHRRVVYDESMFVGYRYYDSVGADVAYPFGHGLSYSTFRYDRLRLETVGGQARPDAFDEDDLSWLRRNEIVTSWDESGDTDEDGPSFGAPVRVEEESRGPGAAAAVPRARFEGDVRRLAVTIDVTNTGSRRASEVVQLYVAPIEPGMYCPVQELEGFAKLDLDPGQTEPVRIELSRRAFVPADDFAARCA